MNTNIAGKLPGLSKKHYYLVACLVFWASVAVMLLGWYDGQAAISYVASSEFVPYAIMLTSVLIVTYLVITFLRSYLFSYLGSSQIFRRLYYIAYLFIVLAALAPAAEGFFGDVHRISTVAAALISIVIFYMLVHDQQVQPKVRIYVAGATIISAGLLFASRTMAAELMSILLAQSSILVVAYTRLKGSKR